ncbi:MAG TPA: hypothetical protein ENK60_00230 [Anaerolineae bacterium]|nr:hypothetical protein [Anaerolineae bacterium]
MKRTLYLSLILVWFVMAVWALVVAGLSTPDHVQAANPIQVTPPVSNAITLQVQTSTDDTSVRVVTKENLYDWAYLRIGTSETPYINGFRFQNVTIPAGSRIVEARLRLYKGEWHTQYPIQLTIQAEASANAQTFSNEYPLASERARTAARVAWTISQPPPNLSWFESPDITSVVQEVVDQPGWQAGNALVILLASTEENEADHYLDALSYDFRPEFAPQLEIIYVSSTPVPTSTPTVTPTPTITPTPEPGRLAIEQAKPLACNTRVADDTRQWGDNVQVYTGCRPVWAETGPEAVFRLELPFDNTDVLINVYPQHTDEDLDIFLLTSAYPVDCLQGADASLWEPGLDAGVYYVAVDGYDGAADAFTLTASCQVNFENSLYLPVIRRND